MAIIKICEIVLDMLLDIPLYVYGPYISAYRKGIKQLITQCMNEIYGTMVASLMYYCRFLKTLKLNKFKMDLYDICVANRLVNGLQKSIILHVDDCMYIHNDPKVNGSSIEVLRE